MSIIKAVKKLRKPIKMSVEERTSGLLKEGRDYKVGDRVTVVYGNQVKVIPTKN